MTSRLQYRFLACYNVLLQWACPPGGTGVKTSRAVWVACAGVGAGLGLPLAAGKQRRRRLLAPLRAFPPEVQECLLRREWTSPAWKQYARQVRRLALAAPGGAAVPGVTTSSVKGALPRVAPPLLRPRVAAGLRRGERGRRGEAVARVRVADR